MTRYLRNSLWFCAGVFIAFVWLVPYAHAQALPAASVAEAIEAIHLAKGTVTTVATANGVAANAGATVSALTPSGAVNVGVNVAAQVERAAIAKAAARAFAKAVPGVGTAIALAEIADALSDKGYRLNPNTGEGEAFEQPGVPGDAPGTGYQAGAGANTVTAKSPSSVCPMLNGSDAFWDYLYVASGMSCTGTQVRKSDGFSAPIGTTFPISKIQNWYVPKYILATEVQTQQDVLDRMVQQHEMQKRFYDALKGDQKNFPGPWPDLYNPTSPLTPVVVSASPASSPQRVVQTETITNPDGSTRTRTTTEQSTVSPVTSGGTIGDTKTTFPSQTTKTVTDRDNATGQVTTGTTVVNNPAPTETTPTTPTNFPNDYNREVTQQSIAKELAGEGAPALPDMTQKTQEALDKSKTEIDKMFNELPEQFVTDKEKWFSWVWTPPIAECAPSTGSIHGVAVSLDICPTVNMIREALGWLFAIFGAWTIYLEIFKRPV